MVRKHTLITGALVLMALAAVAVLGPMLLKALTPDRLAATNTLIDRIWWPATGLRCAVYVVLAFVVYPLWVRGRRRDVEARYRVVRLTGVNLAEGKGAWLAARLEHLTQAAQRGPWVLLGFLISDGVLAQFPYWFLRG